MTTHDVAIFWTVGAFMTARISLDLRRTGAHRRLEQNYQERDSPPRIAARRGGLRHQKDFVQLPKQDAAGVVFH
jgi:hypothetical protein